MIGLLPPGRLGSVAKLDDLVDRVEIHPAALTSADELIQAMYSLKPTEIYNLAAPSFVPASWEDPLGTLDLITGTATRLLKATRQLGLGTRFYQASSSEIFGDVRSSPQTAQTEFRPKNPYGAAKATRSLDDGASPGSAMVCLPVAAFFTTTNRPDARLGL